MYATKECSDKSSQKKELTYEKGIELTQAIEAAKCDVGEF